MLGTTEKKVNIKIKVLSKPFEISVLFIIFRGIWIMSIFLSFPMVLYLLLIFI